MIAWYIIFNPSSGRYYIGAHRKVLNCVYKNIIKNIEAPDSPNSHRDRESLVRAQVVYNINCLCFPETIFYVSEWLPAILYLVLPLADTILELPRKVLNCVYKNIIKKHTAQQQPLHLPMIGRYFSLLNAYHLPRRWTLSDILKEWKAKSTWKILKPSLRSLKNYYKNTGAPDSPDNHRDRGS